MLSQMNAGPWSNLSFFFLAGDHAFIQFPPRQFFTTVVISSQNTVLVLLPFLAYNTSSLL